MHGLIRLLLLGARRRVFLWRESAFCGVYEVWLDGINTFYCTNCSRLYRESETRMGEFVVTIHRVLVVMPLIVFIAVIPYPTTEFYKSTHYRFWHVFLGGYLLGAC